MRYITDGLMVHHGIGPTAWFRLTTHRQELLSHGQWEQMTDRHTQRLAALMGADCQLLGVHRAYSVDDWKLRLVSATPRPNQGFFDEVENTAARLEDYDSGREVYLGVRLVEKKQAGWRDKLGVPSADRWLTAAMPRPTDKQLEEYRRLAQRALNRVQAGALGARPAYAEEIRWLLRRTYWRNLAMPLGEPHRPALGGEAHALLDGAKVENHYHALHVIRRTGEDFWVSVLGFSHLPDQFGDGDQGDMSAGWLHLSEELDFPIEFQVRYRVLPRPEAIRAVSAVTGRVRGQVDHIHEIPGATVPRALQEQWEETEDIEHSVKILRQTLVKTWPRLIVAAASEQELQTRVQDTVDHFHDELEIDLEAPAAAQRRLFKECMPGLPHDPVTKAMYPQEMALKTLAGAGTLIATSLGDQVGPYWGVTTSDNTPVHIDPHYASRANSATLMVLAGVLGRGKSVLAMKTIWWDRLRGASVAMVAPEGCPRGFIDLCREAGRVNELWLDDDEQSVNVSLDPYRIMQDPFEGAQLAATVMQTLLPWGQPSAVKTAILAAVSEEAAKHGHSASLLGAVRMLREEHRGTEGAKAAADVLEFMSKWPVARMLFRETDAQIDLANALTVLQFRGLKLPKGDIAPERWTEQHRIATAAMHGMIAIASSVSDVGGPSHPKLSFYDDAQVVLANPDGRTTIDSMVLRGRKKHETPIIASQNVTHLLSDSVTEQNTLLSNCAVAAVFRLPDEQEARAACRLLHIEPTVENVRLIQTLGPDAEPGHRPPSSVCLLRDLSGNVGQVEIDIERDDLLDAFSTTPQLEVVA